MNEPVNLGADMVGSAMAIDLAKSNSVTRTHLDRERQNHIRINHLEMNMIQFDVRDEILHCEIETVIDAGKNLVNISIFPENDASYSRQE